MTRDGALSAMADTLTLLKERDEQWLRLSGCLPAHGPCSWEHLSGMLERAKAPDFGEHKTMRWLGYIQGVAVALQLLSLDDVKAISKRYAE